MVDGAMGTGWHEYRRGWQWVQGEVIAEALMTLYVNGAKLLTLMSTPYEWNALALGFLKNEGFIQTLEEVDHIYVNDQGCCVDAWLHHAIEVPKHRIVTSGCGGGVTFGVRGSAIEPLESDMRIAPGKLVELFNQLHAPGSLHARARGVHSAGLADGKEILVMVEDIGRHNTIDRLMGVCMLSGIETEGRVLLATGRISSEMLHKGASMGCPIVASRKSPTSMSIEMAEAWNITLVGYARRGTLRVYTHPKRLGYTGPATVSLSEDKAVDENYNPSRP
ncbi:MAG TPA: formate dehydrogenase accessory sulfurtransferase FdhD [Anaerolineae bacterium]|nr:formate dehydrogenase accessory sulfurtransferase FdhD [Anaerolineae bacterium]